MRLFLVALLALFGLGCASMNQRCTYHENGYLETYRLRSTVLGTGNTEVISVDCAVLAYSTEETGLSDNGKDAVGKIAEGAVRGALGNPLP